MASVSTPASASDASDADQYLRWCQNNIRDGARAKADRHCGLFAAAADRAGFEVYSRTELERAVADGNRLYLAVTVASAPPSASDASDADQYLRWCQNNIRDGAKAKADRHYRLYVDAASQAGIEAYSRAEIERAVADGNRLSAGDAIASTGGGSGGDTPSTPSTSSGDAKLASSRSGLPWASGFSCFNRDWSSQEQLRTWRGRKLDVVKGWAPQDSWSSMLTWFKGGGFGALVKSGAQPVVSLPLLTKDNAKRFDACAKGGFDSYFREVAQTVVNRGAPGTVLRLGWEANGSWYSWSAGGDPDGYKQCFRQVAQTIKSVDDRIRIEWPMAKKGHLPFSVDRIWPGGDVVDIIGVVLYDRYPVFATQAIWDDYYNKQYQGGPYGPGAWLAYAKGKGKPLAVGEWGVSDGYRGLGLDNPVFVKNVNRFLRDNADDIAYESYYNCQNNGIYRVFPRSANPKASDAYKDAWG